MLKVITGQNSTAAEVIPQKPMDNLQYNIQAQKYMLRTIKCDKTQVTSDI